MRASREPSIGLGARQPALAPAPASSSSPPEPPANEVTVGGETVTVDAVAVTHTP